MDLKLIVFALVFGIAALVIYAANRANSPKARRRSEQGPTLDTQIGTLAEMGLTLSPGLTRDDLLAWGPEDTYRADPWRLILLTYASKADHRDNRPFCPRATMIDLDDADDPTKVINPPDGTDLWSLENGHTVAVFCLKDVDAQTINRERPGLLSRLVP